MGQNTENRSVIARLADVTVQRAEKLKINYWGNLHDTALQPLKCYLGLFKTNKAKINQYIT